MSIWTGTGHRPDKLGGYDDDTFSKLVDLAEAYIESKGPPAIIISGMALGWDQALAQAAINCNIPFVAAVPFKGQENKWPEVSKERYKKLLDQAGEVVILSSHYDKGVMQQRNIWMVDQLTGRDDHVVALWDGSDGGTKNCIKYAEKKRIKIVNLWPIFTKLS